MPYEILGSKSFKVNDEGERTLLANFSAKIIRETRYVDGNNTETILTITGETPGTNMDSKPIPLPPVEVQATAFPGLSWVLPAWGVRAVIQPGSSIKDDLRTLIQLTSTPETRTIYRTLGWLPVNGKPCFLHASGGVFAKGNDSSIEVQLPPELKRYDLSTVSDLKTSIRATLALTRLAPPDVAWPLLAATLCPLYGPVDFAIHVTGRTGTFKSEFLSLFMSHFGPLMDARHLPGSWSSTANALEAQAYIAANCPFVIDDFVPTGTSYQQKTYQMTADKIFRSQGNQSGRARLTDTSNLQTTMYPRGIILSTGEDTPEGHSIRARMLILELSPGDIKAKDLSGSQASRPLFSTTTRALIQHLASSPMNPKQRTDYLRTQLLEIGHTRTPSMLARLITTIEHFLVFCEVNEATTSEETKSLRALATKSIIAAGEKQQQYLEAADPCELFCAAIRQILASGLGHLRTLNGGIPNSPTSLGWTAENSLGEIPTYKSRGPCLGWVHWPNDELYLDLTAGYAAIKKVAGAELALSKQTMLKRMKDSGLLIRTDSARQRNTIRINADGHPRNVLALSLSTVLDTQEVPSDESNSTYNPDAE